MAGSSTGNRMMLSGIASPSAAACGRIRVGSYRAVSRVNRARPVAVTAAVVEPGSTVLVAGSTGGVGQLLTARLLESGYHVRALTRDAEKAEQFFGKDNENLEVIVGDLRDSEKVHDYTDGVDAVCCVVGTTAFPSKRWDGGNTTEATDKVAVGNLIAETPQTVKRFVLTTSAGVTRSEQFPFSMMNFFKVLTHKRTAEKTLMASGVPYTIFRPCRLTDGPYTSFDLNTVLKATRGSRREVHLSLEDTLSGEASRITVAEAILQSLQSPYPEGHAISIESRDGDGPQQDPKEWKLRFASVA